MRKKGSMKGFSIKSGDKRATKSGAGMTKKGVAKYRRQNPGSKLQTAVTEKKPTGKRAARRKSYCARSAGQMKSSLRPPKTLTVDYDKQEEDGDAKWLEKNLQLKRLRSQVLNQRTLPFTQELKQKLKESLQFIQVHMQMHG